MIALSWVHAAAVAAEPGRDDTDFRSYLDQARFFLRKEWYADAREQLELAVGTDDGKLDPEAWFLLASVRYELGDLMGARDAADRALVHSRDQEQARQTRDLLAFFEEKFGYVSVEAPYAGVSATLTVELESTLFDPNLKTWLAQVVDRLHDPVTLPYVLGLPAARYTINGVDVEVVAGSTVSITPKLGGAPPASLQSVTAEISLGAVGHSGAQIANLSLAPATEVSIGMPVSVLSLGVSFGWAVQSFAVRDPVSGGEAHDVAPFTWSIGARAGVELGGPIVVRPSVAWRVGLLPGVEVGCSEGPSAWTCDRNLDGRQLYVYTSAIAHALGADLALVYRDPERLPLGFGVRGGADLLLGALPREGTAESPEGAPLAFSVPADRGVTGGGWHALLLTSWSF